MKNSFIEKLNKRNEPLKSSHHGFHSAAYHRYFEGYSEYTTIDEKGRTRIKRVYNGEYYSHDFEKKRRVLLKAALLLIWIAACAISLTGAAQNGVGNNRWYVVICQAGDIIGFAWAFSGLFNYLINPRMMTIGDWRTSSLRLKRGSLIAAIFLMLTAIMLLVDLALATTGIQEHVLVAGCFFAAGLLMLLERHIEVKVQYKKTPSEAYSPDDASHIS